MGRNRELNKIRRRTQREKSTGGGGRVSAHSNGEGASAGEDKRQRGSFASLCALLWAYPFVAIVIFVSIVKLVPLCMRWVRLRSGLVGPVMDVHAEKQVLILGAIGSGTTDTSRALQKLGIEVGYEVSDSSRHFCRDGTVSWVHAIRFLSGTPNFALLCAGPRQNAYHSTMIRPSQNCTRFFRSWDQCWADECKTVTAREFGCALREAGVGGGIGGDFGDNGERCSTPFRKTLLQAPGMLGVKEEVMPPRLQFDLLAQYVLVGFAEPHVAHAVFHRKHHHDRTVRHPLQYVAYLAMKSSPTAEGVGVDCSNARHHVAAITALFPNSVIREHIGAARSGGGRHSNQEGTTTYFGGDATDPLLGFDWMQAASTCVELWAWHWVVYNTAVLPNVDGFYRIEDTSPNEVATLAGFSGTNIDQAHEVAVKLATACVQDVGVGQACEESESEGRPSAEASAGVFELTWDDIAAYPNGLLREVSDLAVRLGYDGAPSSLLPDAACGADGSEQVASEVDDNEGAAGGRLKSWLGMLGFGKQATQRRTDPRVINDVV